MNVKAKHIQSKPFSLLPLFNGAEGTVASMQILKGERFPEHQTKIPAFLVCVSGEVVFHYVSGTELTLRSGDYITITPNSKHWVDAHEDSQLLLMK